MKDHEKFRVLVIENDAELARLLLLGLHRAGLECDLASDGASGLESVGETSPHLVLLDVALPDVDSNIVCLGIRRLSRAPILLLSRGHEEEMLSGFAWGADGFLNGPWHSDLWTASVAALLRRVYTYDEVESVTGATQSRPTLTEIIRQIARWRTPFPQTIGEITPSASACSHAFSSPCPICLERRMLVSPA